MHVADNVGDLPNLLRDHIGQRPLAEIAEKVGISVSYLSRLRSGKRTGERLTDDIATRLAQEIGCEPVRLKVAAGLLPADTPDPRPTFVKVVECDANLDHAQRRILLALYDSWVPLPARDSTVEAD